MKTSLLLIALVCGWTRSFAQTNAAIRLALVATDDSLRPVTDLLTVELSRNERVSLVERTEIERVLREQALSVSGKDCLKLGLLLKADGLLIASLSTESGEARLGLRLVAVKPGVVLGVARSPWPVEMSPEWAHGLATPMQSLIPKLGVLVKDAIPVSVVDLRSAVRSREGEANERELTVLLIERLTRENQLFVLERRSMQALTAESDLEGLNDTEFWNGSYLVEGTLDRDGYSRELLTVNAQLRPPRSGSPITIEVRSSRTNLHDVVNQIADKIKEALKLQAGVSSWNPREEADKYFAEAQWAYRWGMLPEAAMASEASWALGRHTADVAALRILSYYEDGVDRSQGWYDLERRLVTFGPGVRAVPGEFTQPYEPPPGCGVPPEYVRFNRVRRAMDLYCAGFREFIATNPKPGWEWHDLGIDLLEGASYWLRHYYYTPEGRVGQEQAIADVRGFAQEIAGLIGGQPAYTNDFGRDKYFSSKPNWGYELAVKVHRDRGTLLETKANWGAYWFATPEAGLALYREIVDRGEMPKVRRLFVTTDILEVPVNGRTGGTLPTPRVLSYLTGWKWQDRQRVLEVWHRFVGELCSSTNLQTRADGLFLQCAQAPSREQHDRYFRELLAFLEEHQNELPIVGDGESLVTDLDALIESRRIGQVSLDEILDERKRAVKRLRQTLADSSTRRARWAKVGEMKAYLAADDYDFAKFSELFLQFDYQPEDARALLAVLPAYRSNLAARVETLNRDLAGGRGGQPIAFANDPAKRSALIIQSSLLNSSKSWVDRLEQTLIAALNPAVSPAPAAVAGSPPSVAPSAAQHVTSAASATATARTTNALVVTRFWPLPDRLPQAEEPSELSIATWCFRDGQLWVDARAMRFGTFAGQETFLNRAAIFAVELDSLKSQGIALDPRTFSMPKRGLFEQAARAFEVHNGWLYVSSADAIRRYSLKARTWEALPVPIQGHARIMFIDDRMLLTTEDSILEATPDGKQVRILASGRRLPPTTTLDGIKSYNFAPIIKGPEGSLVTFVDGKFCEWPQNGADWKPQSNSGEFAQGTCALFDAGLVLAVRSAQSEQKFALLSGSRSPVLLLSQLSRRPGTPMPALRTQPSPGMSSAQPRWQFLNDRPNSNQALFLDADSLWIISSPPGGMSVLRPSMSPEELDVVLYHFEQDQSQPRTIPLRLRLPESLSGSRRLGGLPGGVALLESTPKGLAIALPRVPGFWLVSQTQLAEARNAQRSEVKQAEPTRVSQ